MHFRLRVRQKRVAGPISKVNYACPCFLWQPYINNCTALFKMESFATSSPNDCTLYSLWIRQADCILNYLNCVCIVYAKDYLCINRIKISFKMLSSRVFRPFPTVDLRPFTSFFSQDEILDSVNGSSGNRTKSNASKGFTLHKIDIYIHNGSVYVQICIWIQLGMTFSLPTFGKGGETFESAYKTDIFYAMYAYKDITFWSALHVERKSQKPTSLCV